MNLLGKPDYPIQTGGPVGFEFRLPDDKQSYIVLYQMDAELQLHVMHTRLWHGDFAAGQRNQFSRMEDRIGTFATGMHGR
jgi:hypothetical protein